MYAEVAAKAKRITEVRVSSPGMVWCWANRTQVLSPMSPRSSNFQENRLFITLQPENNTLLFKLHFGIEPQHFKWRCEVYGVRPVVETALQGLINRAPDDLTRFMGRYTLDEIYAVQGDEQTTHRALDDL